MGSEALAEHLPVPLWDRHLIRLRCNSVPKRLDVADLIFDRQLVKPWGRKWEAVGHTLDCRLQCIPWRVLRGAGCNALSDRAVATRRLVHSCREVLNVVTVAPPDRGRSCGNTP